MSGNSFSASILTQIRQHIDRNKDLEYFSKAEASNLASPVRDSLIALCLMSALLISTLAELMVSDHSCASPVDKIHQHGKGVSSSTDWNPVGGSQVMVHHGSVLQRVVDETLHDETDEASVGSGADFAPHPTSLDMVRSACDGGAFFLLV